MNFIKCYISVMALLCVIIIVDKCYISYESTKHISQLGPKYLQDYNFQTSDIGRNIRIDDKEFKLVGNPPVIEDLKVAVPPGTKSYYLPSNKIDSIRFYYVNTGVLPGPDEHWTYEGSQWEFKEYSHGAVCTKVKGDRVWVWWHYITWRGNEPIPHTVSYWYGKLHPGGFAWGPIIEEWSGSSTMLKYDYGTNDQVQITEDGQLRH